jgi:hypothetical protein
VNTQFIGRRSQFYMLIFVNREAEGCLLLNGIKETLLELNDYVALHLLRVGYGFSGEWDGHDIWRGLARLCAL